MQDTGNAPTSTIQGRSFGPSDSLQDAFQRYRRIEQGPMNEATCAENYANYFNDIEPIPQTNKPDFSG